MGRSVQAESSSDPEVTMWTSGLGSHMDTCARWHPTPQLPFGMVHLPWSQVVIKSHGLNLHCMPGTMPSTLHTLPVSIGVQPVAQHKIINLLKTLWIFFSVIMCGNACNVWSKTTLLLPVWPRDAQRLDASVCECSQQYHGEGIVIAFIFSVAKLRYQEIT